MPMKLPRIHSPQLSTTLRNHATLIVVGLVLVALSVVYTWRMSVGMRQEQEVAIAQLRQDERNAVEMWEDILRSTNIGGQMVYNPELLHELAEHTNVPLIIADERLNVWVTNLSEDIVGNPELLRREIMLMSQNNKPISVTYGVMNQTVVTIYYGMTDYENLVSSRHSRALALFPYMQLCIILIFAVFAYIAFVSAKQGEHNRVWIGLAKETAHQLGTPISSLMAWTEVLKEKYPSDEMLPEMEHDVARLQRVAERFSKIGSKPEHVAEDLVSVIERSVEYVKRRTPSQVKYELSFPKRPLLVRMNAPLLEWVLENLCKNAVDAMNGEGMIRIIVSQNDDNAFVDITDSGKGIAKSCHKRVFEPGYTTKKRGWGLGLSLAKRIVEQYHKGRIFVKSSSPGKGTTFRLELKK